MLQESELERITGAREAELKYIRDQNEVEISKAKDMAEIETGKFENTVKAIGADTLRAIAVSGPEMQVRRQCARVSSYGKLLLLIICACIT